MKIKILTLIIFLSALLLGISACERKKLMKTPEGIPRKVVIREDDTLLYDSAQLNNSVETANQWQAVFVFGQKENYYIVAKDTQRYKEKAFYYIKASDVFEWNSYFCLTYKNSPHNSDRSPILIYETLKGAKEQDPSDIVLYEKNQHSASGSDVRPILKEHPNQIYYIASLYDDIDEDGNYVFLGHYNFGFEQYNDEAHELCRYVSKNQLSEQLALVLGVTGKGKKNLNPREVDKIYGPLIEVLAEFDTLEKGLEDIREVFRGTDVPSVVETGPLDPDSFTSNIEKVDPKLEAMAVKMLDHIRNSQNWNEDGYTYIPVEWMEVQK